MHWNTATFDTEFTLERAVHRYRQTQEVRERKIRHIRPYIPPFPILPPKNRDRIKSSTPPISRLYPETTTLFIPLVIILERLVHETNFMILRRIYPSPLRENPSNFPPQTKQTNTPIKPRIPPNAFFTVILSSLNKKCAIIVENITPVPLRIEQLMDDAVIMAIYWKA